MSREGIINNAVPKVHRPRTTHKYKDSMQTTGNVGEIIPIFVDELIQPGDTLKINLNAFSRLTVSSYPSMDNLVLDIYAFAQQKNNMVLGYSQFLGENLEGAFEQTAEYEMPKLLINGTHTSARSLYNRLYGLPFSSTAYVNLPLSALPLLMYWQVYNDWFRDQNYIAPVYLTKTSSNPTYYINMLPLNQQTQQYVSGITTDPYSTNLQVMALAKACRFHDYFSSILPEPQKGDPTQIPLTGEVTGAVYGDGTALQLTSGDTLATLGLAYADSHGYSLTTATTNYNNLPQSGASNIFEDIGRSNYVGVPTQSELGENSSGLTATINLADAVIGTMNDMRTLVAQQHFLENNGIFGTREKEIIRSRYGVTSPAIATHTPEYLGGKRIPINMDTVLQTSSTSTESPLGAPAGYSVTFDSDHVFTKSFDYPSVVMILAVVRQTHRYSQGIPCQHQKFKILDYWTPEFNNIGCQPIYMQEIYVDPADRETDKDVWGYKMPWQEYREGRNLVTGMLSPTYSESLDVWNYADYYENAPVASQEWLLETPQYVDRTLTITSKLSDQFIFDFAFDVTKISEVPEFSIPGLKKF